MSSIANAAATRPSATQFEPPHLESLSSTALLEHGTAIAEHYDEQIRGSIDGMNEIVAASDHVGELRKKVADLLTYLSHQNKGADDKVTLEGDQLDEFELPPEVLEKLTKEDGTVEFSQHTLERLDTELQQEQNQINSSQELRLISIQEAMRQRGQVVQLLSTILRSRGQTDMAIVRNMQ
jgi:hypothetical protein